ncbi:hypothetical protein CBM2589_B180195 [Cupriavidus taiwanensis]|uniref:Uncharacterized protein n=1 Tax=Cupriavidus taiwanensis TaxID=164546 RepID=A0A375BL63_9BURK|nr:hypothetical protein CBM2589_B180195 [Cupriavidus taiwanensis]
MAVTVQRPSGHLRSLKLRVRAADSFFARSPGTNWTNGFDQTCGQAFHRHAQRIPPDPHRHGYRVWLMPMSSVP